MHHMHRSAAPRRALWLLLTLALAGCQSLPCEGDWFQVGRTDGAQGHDEGRATVRSRACQREGKAFDAVAWRNGWRSGLADYCTPAQGETRGVAGQGPAPVCEGPVGADYRDGWNLGMNRYCTRERGVDMGAVAAPMAAYCAGRNRDAYRVGYGQGLDRFCVAEVGYQQGLKQRRYDGECRGRNEDAFLRGYRIGDAVHDTQDKLDEIERRIRKLEAELASSKDDRERIALQARLREAARDQRQLRELLTSLKVSF